jgi:Phage integrase family
VTPHTLHHAAAMALLQRAVDLSLLPLRLGYESIETIEVYLHADMRLEERARPMRPLPGACRIAMLRRTACWPSSKSCDTAASTICRTVEIL